MIELFDRDADRATRCPHRSTNMTATTIEILSILLIFFALRGLWRFIEEERTRKFTEDTDARGPHGRRSK